MFPIRVVNFILVGCLLSAVFAVPARAASEAVVYSFKGPPDGNAFGPSAGLIDVGGALYGTTGGGEGTVFKVTLAGVEKVLHSFGVGNDGFYSQGGLIDVGGTLYGTTAYGGAHAIEGGEGTVFKVTPAGVEKVLHSFSLKRTDGDYPSAGLIDVGGTLYGTTSGGGAYHGGTVFTVTPAGVERVLHSFGVGNDGFDPDAGLIDVGGTLYGTTYYGGAHGYGTVFTVTPAGVEKVLYSFGGGNDGAYPSAGLIDVGGTLYGTTAYGGAYYSGTVFKVTPVGGEKVVYCFKGLRDGASPVGGLIYVDGTLYGTTGTGGAYGNAYNGGTVFKVTPAGVERVLHSFGEGNDGSSPVGGLIDVGGTLYGTTSGGGAHGYGTVFKESP
jgi:uncharacterized repeat protein (TIGR03803 family)